AGRLAGQAGLPAGEAAGALVGGPGTGRSEVAATLVASAPETLAPGALPAGKGQVLLAVRWPARYRAQVIPGTATRAHFAVRKGQATVATTSVSRPAGAATSTASLDLDAGIYTLIATAAADTRAVATGSAPITVVAGARTAASLTLAEAAIAYTVSTLAGGAYRDGASDSARFSVPGGLAVDATGNVFVADSFNNRIRKVGPDGSVSTLAGDGTAGSLDGPGGSARFYQPTGIAVDASGSVYVSEAFNQRIRKITPAGVVTTLAGDGTAGFADGASTSARFRNPVALAVDASGTLYVADRGNNRIRKVTPGGFVSTLAGDGTAAFADGASTSARFNNPVGVAVDATGTVYVADSNNQRIRTISSGGTVATLAGDGTSGFADGAGAGARFRFASGLAVDASGTVYVADITNHRIRAVTQAGVVTTFCGSGTAGSGDGACASANFNRPRSLALTPGGALLVGERESRTLRRIAAGAVTRAAGANAYTDGVANVALFDLPEGVALDGSGSVFVADMISHSIRRISAEGEVTTLAGNGSEGFADGQGTAARFNSPMDLTVASSGDLYVADHVNHRIRKVSPSGLVSTFAGDGTGGFVNGQGTAARFSYPWGMAMDAGGGLYVTDAGNNAVRRVSSTGLVSTLAGDGTGGYVDGPGASARFASPRGVAVDSAGVVYVADTGNHRVRRINQAGVVDTLAGDGTAGFADGAGVAARFNQPYDMAIDGAGTLYVTDAFNFRVRRISPAGVVTTIAGGAAAGSRDGSAFSASFRLPTGIAIDAGLNLYVVDRWNHAIRVLR
ncbi:MAG: hypothetical protein FJZ01_22845, partial [Candidatus Sericytochromatia bacterium]|nr:hypothetical protein [Candidatus Tanganyikabacteria bacterium]